MTSNLTEITLALGAEVMEKLAAELGNAVSALRGAEAGDEVSVPDTVEASYEFEIPGSGLKAKATLKLEVTNWQEALDEDGIEIIVDPADASANHH